MLIMFLVEDSITYENLQKFLFDAGWRWEGKGDGRSLSHWPYINSRIGICLHSDGVITYTTNPQNPAYGKCLKINIHNDDLPHVTCVIAGLEVTDLSPTSAKVGCTVVSYEEVCGLKEAMEKSKKS